MGEKLKRQVEKGVSTPERERRASFLAGTSRGKRGSERD